MPGHNSISSYLILINSAGSSWRVKIRRQFKGNQCSGKLKTFVYLSQICLAEQNLPEAVLATLSNTKFSTFDPFHLAGTCHPRLKKASEFVRAPMGRPGRHGERTARSFCVCVAGDRCWGVLGDTDTGVW